jgi:hypothetical protein
MTLEIELQITDCGEERQRGQQRCGRFKLYTQPEELLIHMRN